MMIESICPDCQSPFTADQKDIGSVYVCENCGIECIVPSLRINPGERFGKYEVLYPIGAGSSSEVHLARNTESDEQVAVKVLFLDDSSMVDVKRFYREARNASSLQHENIIRIHDMDSVGDYMYLAMEYVDGQTLTHLLRDHGPLAEVDALSICRDVAAALDYAWGAKQLIHRDIKPANIMVSYDGRTKLMDLGIAKSLMYDFTQLTEEDTILGTPIYMSPEQCAPGKPIDFRADMYSLGATLYHVVTDCYPFTGKDPMDLVRKHLFSKPEDPRRLNPNLSEMTTQLIQRLMAKSANQRPDDWASAMEEIDAVIGMIAESRG